MDAPETHYRPIRAASEPTERVLSHDLIATENDNMRKILTVLVFNCEEIHDLKDIAETKLYGRINMFGQQPIEVAGDDDSRQSDHYGPGEREKMIGRFLPNLQEISNFIDRCYSVAVNLVQQLSALYDSKHAHYRSTFQSTHLQHVFMSLGQLLQVMITFDTIIQKNDLLVSSWSAFKMMIPFIRDEPSNFGTSEEGITKFERLLVSVDQTVLVGKIFEGCIEQNFEAIDDGSENGDGGLETVRIRSNQTFLSELLTFIRTNLDVSLEKIDSNSELEEKYGVIVSFALYALYRRLTPRNVPPDQKLYKALWGVQKIVPFVVLCDKVLWYPPEFLQNHSALDAKYLEPANPIAYRKQYMVLILML